jgi:hypothetical protein
MNATIDSISDGESAFDVVEPVSKLGIAVPRRPRRIVS